MTQKKKRHLRKKRGAARDASDISPQAGIVGHGEPFVPRLIPEDLDKPNPLRRFAPGPGVPVDEEEYKRLKEKAESERKKDDSGNAQEDPAAKKK